MRRWEELRPVLDGYGVQIVTVSTDSTKALRKGHPRHKLVATMLADPDLQVTDIFGLRNQLVQSSPNLKPQPVPTSILADANGVVLWMDQSVNYQRRSDPDYVKAALKKHLGSNQA